MFGLIAAAASFVIGALTSNSADTKGSSAQAEDKDITLEFSQHTKTEDKKDSNGINRDYLSNMSSEGDNNSMSHFGNTASANR
jgi:hypothetical protein